MPASKVQAVADRVLGPDRGSPSRSITTREFIRSSVWGAALTGFLQLAVAVLAALGAHPDFLPGVFPSLASYETVIAGFALGFSALFAHWLADTRKTLI